jgi:hypothetical protein
VPSEVKPRRFPPPWTIEETNDACFIVRDSTGQALAYFYFEDEPGRLSVAKIADPRRGAAHRGEHCQAAGATEEAQCLGLENSTRRLTRIKGCPPLKP